MKQTLLILMLAIGLACSNNTSIGNDAGSHMDSDAADSTGADTDTSTDAGTNTDTDTDTSTDAGTDAGTSADTDSDISDDPTCGSLGERCCPAYRCTETGTTCHDYKCEAAVLWDVMADFGVSTTNAKPGTDAAIAAAKDYLLKNPGEAVVLQYPAGTFHFLGNQDNIDLGNGFDPGDGVGLVFEGAGKEATKFITAPEPRTLVGRNVSHVTFRGIHFARDYLTVTQGTVLEINPNANQLTLQLHSGFPTPEELWTVPGIDLQQGKYMKRYLEDNPADPHIDTVNNKQSSWDPTRTYETSPGVWVFGGVSRIAQYSLGDLMGVKVKHGGDVYWFCGADDVVFEDCRWTHKTRGTLRCGTSNVRFSGCDIQRLPKVQGRVPFMASNEGGPQIGQPDATSTNAIVEDCLFIASGDDNVAFFRVNSGLVRNVVTRDPFARAILLHESPNVQLCDNTVDRGPIQGAYQECQ